MPRARVEITPEVHYLRVIDEKTGNEIKYAIEVDTDEGWVECYALDANGNLRSGGGIIETEILRGKYKVEFDEGSFYGRRLYGVSPKWVPWSPNVEIQPNYLTAVSQRHDP